MTEVVYLEDTVKPHSRDRLISTGLYYTLCLDNDRPERTVTDTEKFNIISCMSSLLDMHQWASSSRSEIAAQKLAEAYKVVNRQIDLDNTDPIPEYDDFPMSAYLSVTLDELVRRRDEMLADLRRRRASKKPQESEAA